MAFAFDELVSHLVFTHPSPSTWGITSMEDPDNSEEAVAV